MLKSPNKSGAVEAGYRQYRPRVGLGWLKTSVHEMGLLSRLLIAEAAVFVIVFAVGIFLLSEVTGYLKSETRQGRMLLAKSFAADLDASFAKSTEILSRATDVDSDASALDESEDEQTNLNLAQVSSQLFDRGIAIVGQDGRVQLADDAHPELLALDLGLNFPGLLEPRADSSALVTGAWHEGEEPIVALGIAVNDRGLRRYVVGLMNPMQSYPATVLVRAVRLGGSGHADLVDGDGVDLFSTESAHVLRDSDHPTSYRRLFTKGQATVAELLHEEKSSEMQGRHLMAFVPLQSVPWAVAVGTTESEAFATERALWYGGIGVLALLTTLAFAATVLVSRNLVQPVRYLSAAARSVAEGNRDLAIEIPWGGEIGELAESLETMRTHLQAWGSELEGRVRSRTQELEDRNRELRGLYDRLREKEEQLRRILEKVLVAQEDERKRVSRELHDGLGQALSAVSMGLERLERARPDELDLFEGQIEALKQLAGDALRDLRRLTIALRPAALDDLGLAPAIRRYADLYLGSVGIQFQVRDGRPGPRLERSLETVIYRVAQEAINNIARHSGATRATIEVRSRGNAVELTVVDDGRGFDPSLPSVNQGLGLQGMRERVSMAGGRLTLDSRPGDGTSVRLTIPVEQAAPPR